MCENKTIVVKTNNMFKKFIMIYMLKQLIDVNCNKIFVWQTAGKGTSCPASVWQTDLHTGTQVHTADKWQPAISRFGHTSYLNLCWGESVLKDLRPTTDCGFFSGTLTSFPLEIVHTYRNRP